MEMSAAFGRQAFRHHHENCQKFYNHNLTDIGWAFAFLIVLKFIIIALTLLLIMIIVVFMIIISLILPLTLPLLSQPNLTEVFYTQI